MKKIAVAVVMIALVVTGLSLVVDRRGAEAGTSDATYVPGKKCKMCHIKIFKKHAETAHAKSLENLTDAGEEGNPECVSCHATGYGKPGGFVDASSTPGLGGTTCQACHGPGSAHVEKGQSKEQRRETIEKTPGATCAKCHKPHEEHPDIGSKGLPSLKKQLEKLQNRIGELGG